MGHHGDCEGDNQHSGAVGAVSLRKLLVKSNTLVLCPAMNPIVTGSDTSQPCEALWPDERHLHVARVSVKSWNMFVFSQCPTIFIFWHLLFHQPELSSFFIVDLKTFGQ